MPLHNSYSTGVQHPHSPSIGNWAGVGCNELQPVCSVQQHPHAYSSCGMSVTVPLLPLSSSSKYSANGVQHPSIGSEAGVGCVQ